MSEVVDFGDDDTGRIRTEAARAPASDPGDELRGLAVAFISHEASDSRRWRQLAGLIALAADGLHYTAAGATAISGVMSDDTTGRFAVLEDRVERVRSAETT